MEQGHWRAAEGFAPPFQAKRCNARAFSSEEGNRRNCRSREQELLRLYARQGLLRFYARQGLLRFYARKPTQIASLNPAHSFAVGASALRARSRSAQGAACWPSLTKVWSRPCFRFVSPARCRRRRGRIFATDKTRCRGQCRKPKISDRAGSRDRGRQWRGSGRPCGRRKSPVCEKTRRRSGRDRQPRRH